ncbi:MAG TPA: DUF4185 domain-containing protein [Spirochaetota bacterium]|nr:DUF4185 domain-containing protein [Spirochaetota bacterium]
MTHRRSRAFAIISVSLFFLFACSRGTESLGVFGASRMESVLGQDGVTPIPFNDTLTMWTFGDTILGQWKGRVSASATFSEKADVHSMISNSLAFSPSISNENVRDLRFSFHREDGRVAQFLKLRPGERPERDRLWAVDGLRRGEDLYVYYFRIRITEPGKPFGFRMEGVGIAHWSVPPAWRPGQAIEFRRLPDLFAGGYPAFGASVIERSGMAYTIGQYIDRDGSSPVKLARSPLEGIDDPRAYEFLAADGSWVRAIDRAHGFFGDVAGECSLSYNENTGEYIIVYSRTGTGAIVVVRFREFASIVSAPALTVYDPPALPGGEGGPRAWYYSGKEIFSEGRDLYAVYMHPLEYQPYLVRIRLP